MDPLSFLGPWGRDLVYLVDHVKDRKALTTQEALLPPGTHKQKSQ